MILDLYITYKKIEEIDIIQDLIIKKRDSVTYDCFFYDENNTLVDITGATLFFTIKEKSSDTDETAILKKTITSLTNSTDGEAKIELNPTDTNLTVGNYIYDIQIKLSTGEIYTCLEGNICVKQDITIRTS
jgi:hypothetical protein